MSLPKLSEDGSAEGKPLRRSRIFHYLATVGFTINMIVVAVIVYYWVTS